jgi:hypothetical protein
MWQAHLKDVEKTKELTTEAFAKEQRQAESKLKWEMFLQKQAKEKLIAEQRAANVMQQRRRTDTAKTASRAKGIAKRVAKKKIEATVRAGVSGGTPKKQVPKTTAKKTTVKKSGKK